MSGLELPAWLPGWAQALAYVTVAVVSGALYWNRVSKPKAESDGVGPRETAVVVSGNMADTISMARLASAIETLASAESEQSEAFADGMKDVCHELERTRPEIRDLIEEMRRNTRAAENLTDEFRLSRSHR